MYPLEIGFILVALGFLVAQNVRGLGTKYPYVLLAAGLATIVLTVFLGQMRWQMAPAYLLFAILCLLFLKRSYFACRDSCGRRRIRCVASHGQRRDGALQERRPLSRGVEHGRRTYGRRQREPLQAGVGQGRPAVLRVPAAREPQRLLSPVTIAGTRHLDFTDDTFVLPLLKWLGLAGTIDGARMIELTNAVVLRFFDAYLRGGPKPRFDGEFPELTVEMNDHAARE